MRLARAAACREGWGAGLEVGMWVPTLTAAALAEILRPRVTRDGLNVTEGYMQVAGSRGLL